MCKYLQAWWLKKHPRITGVCERCSFKYDRHKDNEKNSWECPKCGAKYP